MDRIPFEEKDFQKIVLAGWEHLLGRAPTRFEMTTAAKKLASIETEWPGWATREVRAHAIRFACHLVRNRIEKYQKGLLKTGVSDPVKYTLGCPTQFSELVRILLAQNRFWASKGREPRPIDYEAYFSLELEAVA